MGALLPQACTVAYVDDDLVALVDVRSSGVIVAPRSHAPATAAGSPILLAALRRAALHVERFYGATAVTIEPGNDCCATGVHGWYRVAPGNQLALVGRREHDTADQARRLREALRAPDLPTPSGGARSTAVMWLDPPPAHGRG